MPPSPSTVAVAEPTVELSTYRLACVVAAGLLPVFGSAFHHADSTFFDPIAVRWVLGGLALALCAGTYASAWVRAQLEALALVFGYVVIGWSVVLLAANNLAAEYAVGHLAVLTMMGVATLGMRRLWAAVLLMAVSTGAGLGVAFLLPAPEVSAPIFGLATAAAGLAILTGTAVRMHTQDRASDTDLRYRAIVETTTEGLVLVDPETLRFLHANGAFLTTTGYALGELRRRALDDLLDVHRSDLEAWMSTLRRDGQARMGEVWIRHKGGRLVALSVAATRIEQRGRPVLCVTAHDLTEHHAILAEAEAARERAEEMLRLKSSFLNNMSHELRTPLVSIFGFAEILTEETSAELREIAETIHRSARRLYDTLNGVLDLAQLESGGIEFDPEVVDVSAVAEAVVGELRPLAEHKGLNVRVKTAPGARVLADTVAVQRVLTHLVANAVKFTERGGIGVDVEADSHRVIIRVSDTGIGIDEAFLPRVFDAFEQASTGMDRCFEGSGLGLAITKQLLDLMGGRIMIKSVPDEGTTVVVAFARTWADPNEDEPPTAVPAGLTAGLTARPRLLVVEDNADTRRLIAHTLDPAYEVVPVAGAEDALTLAAQAWFDAVLLDINLSDGGDGVALLRALRSMPAYAYVPAIAMTAGLPGDRERLLRSGFDGVLAKPFTRAEMLDALETLSAEGLHA